MPPTSERYTSNGHPITVEVFSPATPGRHAGCLILHGTFGLLPEYRADIVSFGEALAGSGVVAMLPHYFERTGTTPGQEAAQVITQHLPDWLAACRDALLFARNDARVDSGRLGVIGFSLGGHLALDLGMSPPSGITLKCVVDFFGPTQAPPLRGNRSALPPLQIHHGANDTLVPITESEHLVTQLRAAGKTEGLGYHFTKYPGQGHGFTGSALNASRASTVTFVTASV
jgi:dienelactone hydrolase